MRKQLLNLKFLLMLCMIFCIGGGSVAFAEEETIVFANGTYSNNQIVWPGTSCTITQSQGESTTKPSSSYVNAPRWYAKHVISFLANENYTISSVTVVATSDDYATALGNSTYSNGASAEVSSSTVTITANGDFTITMSAQSRISSVTVTYTKGTSTTPSISVLKKSLSFDQVETGSNKEMTFTLTGENLTEPASLTIDGTGKDMFSVSPSSVSPTDGTISETTITVTYAPTTAGDHVAALNITSGEATATVNLSGTGVNSHTVSWNVNGVDYTEGEPTTKVIEGEKVETLPTAPADRDGKLFVGWTNNEMLTSQDEVPSVFFRTADEAPVVTANTTYYAVFATASEGGATTETLTEEEIVNIGSLSYTTKKEYFGTNLSYVIYGYKDNGARPWIQQKKDVGVYIKITAPSNITKVDLTITSATNTKGGAEDITKHSAFSGTVGLVTTDCIFTETSENIGSTNTITENKASITTTSETKELYIKVSSGARIWDVTTYYGGVQYSGYITKVSSPVTSTLNLVAKDNEMYYATFSSSEDVIFPSDVEVDAVSVDGTTLNITELTKGKYDVKTTGTDGYDVVSNAYYVPANTGVLIQSKENSVKYYDAYKTETVALPTNQLKPAPAGGGEFTSETGYKYYKLAYNNYEEKTGLGFYWGEDKGGVFSVKAGTAYLAVPTSKTTNVKGFSFDGTTTGISAVAAEGTAKINEIYNIAGQRVNAMTKAGLYIVNGKKMVIKK